MTHDLVIGGGTVYDGSGSAGVAADVAIQGDRIARIDARIDADARRTLDARGLAVAPGFIDIHSHSDWVLPSRDHDVVLAPLLAQGITTIVTGNCGFSPAPVTDASASIVESSSELLREDALTYEWRSVAEFLDGQSTLQIQFP